MTEEKIREAISLYRKKFVEMNIVKETCGLDSFPGSFKASLASCHAILDEVENFLEEGSREKLEKAFRWLGFIQGCLWSAGVYTINDLREHNK